MNIKKGDKVIAIAGKDKGKTGTISRVLPQAQRVVVDGLNMYKKRVRPKKQGEQGEVVEISRSMNASNVSLVCGNCKKPTRLGIRVDGDKKQRYCKKCEATL